MAAQKVMVNIVAEVSKSALRKLQLGQARMDGYGIKRLDGKKLANFHVLSLDPSNQTDQANQLINAAIHKMAANSNMINGDLRVIKTNTDKILNAMNMLKGVQALQWANLGVSLVNTAISVAGFYMTLKKLDSIDGELKKLCEQWKSARTDDLIETFETHLHNILADLDYLQKRYDNPSMDKAYFLVRSRDIETECNQTAAYLKKVLKEFQEGSISQDLGCSILFTLAPSFAELVNEYCWQYSIEVGGQSLQLEYGQDTIKLLNGEPFRTFMKRKMAFDPYYLKISPEKRQQAQEVAFYCLDELEDNLTCCAKAIQEHPVHELVSFEDYLNQRLWEQIDQEQMAETGESVSEMLTKQIMQMQIDENDETVYIPLRQVYAS